MAAIIMDGKKTAAYVRQKVKEKCLLLKKEKGIVLGLAVILVGDDNASQIYVRNKAKACEEVGINSKQYTLPANTGQEELLKLIDTLNKDDKINGILVQLPLPKHIDEKEVIKAIDPKKDVDAFSNENIGRMFCGDMICSPCTPSGILEMLDYYKIDVRGKHCVVIGRSAIVGKPMAMMLLNRDATVTVCHSKTKDLPHICRQADILVVAVGKPKMITCEYVKPGAVVVDVGINRDENGKLCGDVDFESVKETASYISPVPGGVGPMTIAMLLNNVCNTVN
ncbi:MAG: bifunctional methylenetetrahydrofolate dehydrogenase/methenyltetrahydrofolate cyclohydrolase FolD [Clostridiales bacterium]|nr:bifunctional methylenetetrahydrofolate dehydrogenase/methenyltetrahydrofolate cyclohydrolase FolD [Clostridiales bacterium]